MYYRVGTQHCRHICLYNLPKAESSCASLCYFLLHVLVLIFFSMNTQLHTEGDRWRVTRTIDSRPLQQDVYWSSCKIRIYETRACFNHFICFTIFMLTFFVFYFFIFIIFMFEHVLYCTLSIYYLQCMYISHLLNCVIVALTGHFNACIQDVRDVLLEARVCLLHITLLYTKHLYL